MLERWNRLLSLADGTLSVYVIALVEVTGETYRERLTDLSWFMTELNEPIAR
ncbi:hypothetical protein [Marinomonas flavescens]|uniref:hypothetical protein n=1 Tax=Marinomonas flavescens TaxID=2529379 RepID=UPI001A9FBD53|nr:hypothetical protein [Marinomonas flavescens]